MVTAGKVTVINFYSRNINRDITFFLHFHDDDFAFGCGLRSGSDSGGPPLATQLDETIEVEFGTMLLRQHRFTVERGSDLDVYAFLAGERAKTVLAGTETAKAT